MNHLLKPSTLLITLVLCLCANGFWLVSKEPLTLLMLIPLFLSIQLFAGALGVKTNKLRLKICHHGGVLLCVFALSLAFVLFYHAILAFVAFLRDPMLFVWSALWCFVAEFLLFWNGMICVYCTSVQLGVRRRAIGLLCGMIPILNLIMLGKIIHTVMEEVAFETEKERINSARKQEKICATRYPILLVHGVFFRDSRFFNYWGRIPGELEENGAVLHYGKHPSASSVEDSAVFLAKRIKEIVKETGCEKLNLIAHSKGGLDCRYMLSETDAWQYVASLTTVSTPHRGCLFADALLEKVPSEVQARVAQAYNHTLAGFGETDADFLAAVNDLTAEACEKRNDQLTLPEGILYQSVGSVLEKARGGRFPLNLSYLLVKYYDGPNDGLVGNASFSWGESCRMLAPSGDRGISHGDMIDLNRENIPGFDVREFYVGLVSDLKARGL